MLRGNIGGSRLVRLLNGWAAAEGEPARQDLAERLSGWLNPLDAIRLHAVLQSAQALPDAPLRAWAAGEATDLAQTYRQVRDAVTQAIADHELWRVPERRPATTLRVPSGRLPLSGQGEAEPEAAFTPYRKVCLEWQREMEAKASALRARLRQEVSRVSMPLRQLAMLDASMEQMLGEREQRLLSMVPVMLERRFSHLQRRYGVTTAQTDGPVDTQQWRQPGGWLHAFGQDVREALQAEWQVRLQPAEGLVDAWSNELKKLA